MKMTEFERLLYEHAARVETHMVSPLNRKTEVLTLTRNKKSSAKMRICLIAIAAAFLLGTTAFAISDGGWFTFREKEYSTLPTQQQFAEDVGYEPVLIECFENGYSYSSGSVMDNREIEGEELSEEGFKSAAFVYEKDGDLLSVLFASLDHLMMDLYSRLKPLSLMAASRASVLTELMPTTMVLLPL